MANRFIDFIRPKIREEPRPLENLAYFLGPEAYATLCGSTHRTVADDPDVKTGINLIANLIGSMTIKQMENQDEGPDKRIIDGLSRIIDIAPCRGLTKQQWIGRIVKNLALYGNAYVIPRYSSPERFLIELVPVANSAVVKDPDADPYGVLINGKKFAYDEILHFKVNCDKDGYFGHGIETTATDAVQNLAQSNEITKEFMTKRFMPSIILKVDATAAKLANKRDTITKEDGTTFDGKNLAQKYVDQTKVGEPFIIPANQIQVEQVKPMSLTDLAVNEGVKLNKTWIASLLGIPAFLYGVGDFKQIEYNNMVSTTIMFYAKAIQDELTAKVLTSPRRYFKLNPASLYNYDIVSMGNLMSKLRTMGVTTGNEVREKVGMDPSTAEGMDEFIALENYIPAELLGDQEKLNADRAVLAWLEKRLKGGEQDDEQNTL